MHQNLTSELLLDVPEDNPYCVIISLTIWVFSFIYLPNGQMTYKGNGLVVMDQQHWRKIINDVHQVLGDNPKVVALSSHLGRTSTYQKITNRFYRYTIVNDVAKYSRSCAKGQRNLTILENVKQELRSIRIWWSKLALIFAPYRKLMI